MSYDFGDPRMAKMEEQEKKIRVSYDVDHAFQVNSITDHQYET